MFACLAGHPAIVTRLVQEAELDLKYQDEQEDTAALLAAYGGHTDCVRIIFNRISTILRSNNRRRAK